MSLVVYPPVFHKKRAGPRPAPILWKTGTRTRVLYEGVPFLSSTYFAAKNNPHIRPMKKRSQHTNHLRFTIYDLQSERTLRGGKWYVSHSIREEMG